MIRWKLQHFSDKNQDIFTSQLIWGSFFKFPDFPWIFGCKVPWPSLTTLFFNISRTFQSAENTAIINKYEDNSNSYRIYLRCSDTGPSARPMRSCVAATRDSRRSTPLAPSGDRINRRYIYIILLLSTINNNTNTNKHQSHLEQSTHSNIRPHEKIQISDITPPKKSNIRYLGTSVPPPPPLKSSKDSCTQNVIN